MESPGLEESIIVWFIEDDEQYRKTLSDGLKKHRISNAIRSLPIANLFSVGLTAKRIGLRPT